MTKQNGFLQLRRGLWEHIRDGRMSTTQALAFIYICSEADTRTGVWKGSAKSLSVELRIPERTARDVLERMERGDYIRRFAIRGKHSCYPILVHKFTITHGEHNGEQLDALNSTDANTLRYLPLETREQNGEHSASQRIIENRRERRKPAAKPTRPADHRFQPFKGFAYQAFEAKYGAKPSWQGKDWKGLQNLLASNENLSLDDLQSRWKNYLASTEAFTTKQGGSLAYFCSHADSFISGPILQPVKGGGNGKLAGDALTEANLAAAGYRVQ